MKKPKSMLEFYGKIFLLLGAVFVLCWILTQAGIMKMEPGSRGGPEVFFIVGCASLAAGAVAVIAEAFRVRRKKLILQTGMSVTGTVTSVKQLSYTRWNTSYPYVVRFIYEWEGMKYKGKSCLLWTPPSVKENDPLAVFIDEEIPKHCVAKL